MIIVCAVAGVRMQHSNWMEAKKKKIKRTQATSGWWICLSLAPSLSVANRLSYNCQLRITVRCLCDCNASLIEMHRRNARFFSVCLSIASAHCDVAVHLIFSKLCVCV